MPADYCWGTWMNGNGWGHWGCLASTLFATTATCSHKKENKLGTNKTEKDKVQDVELLISKQSNVFSLWFLGGKPPNSLSLKGQLRFHMAQSYVAQNHQKHQN